MTTRLRLLTVILATTAVAACGASTEPAAQSVPIEPAAPTSTISPPVTSTVADVTTSPPTPASSDTTPPAAPASSDTTAPAASAPSPAPDTTVAPTTALAAWQTLPITDVDGVTFSLADFAGTPVFVETFATWCPKCRAQLKRTNDAALAAGDGAAFIALSVETDLDASEVATYAADNGFDGIRFAVVDPAMLAALVEAFGNSIANPPSTPTFVVAADGSVGELRTGDESADDIAARLSPAG
jgi:thiol-disulfide isomerase/thioredoxin